MANYETLDNMGTLSIPEENSKTGHRVVQLGDDARLLLRQLRSHPQAHKRWMFPSKSGKGPIPCTQSYWERVREEIGLPALRIHDLRHTYASYALTEASIKEVQKMLGHASVVTTERYLHVFDEAVQSAQTRAGGLLARMAVTGQRPTPPKPDEPKTRLTVVK